MVDNVEDRLMTLETKVNIQERRIKVLEEKFSKEETPVLDKILSIKEFLLKFTLTSFSDKVLAVGYYLGKYKGVSSFCILDLRQSFFNAKEKSSSNLNQMVNENIKKGFMMEDETKKEKKKFWMLTSTGERFVENGFEQKNDVKTEKLLSVMKDDRSL